MDVILGPIYNQTSVNYQLERICGSNPKANQRSFHGLHGFFQLMVENVNPPGLKSPNCFVDGPEKLLFWQNI